MGYNLYARCLRDNEVAFVYRGHEAEGIAEWYQRHPTCPVEWAVDNNETTPPWVDDPAQEPIELPTRMGELAGGFRASLRARSATKPDGKDTQ